MTDVTVGSISESAASIRHLIRAVALRGLQLHEGPSAGEPAFRARVSLQRAGQLWEDAVRALGPELPLVVAQKHPEQHISPLFFAAMSCRTMGDALDVIVSHWRYATEEFPVTLVRRNGVVQLRFGIAGPGALGARVGIEYLLADLVRSGCELGGGAWRPVELVLGHRPPISLDAWESACGVAVRVDPESPGLVMSEESLEHPVRTALPPAAKRFFLDLVGSLTPPVSATLRLADRVSAILAEHLGVTAPSVDQVAQQLALSTRSLNRQLAAEGTTYRRLLDQLRRDEALRQTAEEERQLKAIARAVGFADLRGFRRAFKRWTGSTPQEFRRQHV
jgi:AraC-like DNA-binding protein